MATYFISDLHLEKIESSISNIFSEFLERLDEDDQLYILGDLFESWIGDDNVSELSAFVVNQLKLLSKKGIQVSIMHGNRDFLIGNDFCEYQAFRSVVRNPIWQKDFLNFPISKREKIAGETKNASKDSKVKKTMEIMDVNDEAVLKAFDDNEIGIMIHGHTHRPNVHKISNDDRIFTRYVLGDWSKESAIILKWDEAGIELLDLADSH